MEVLRKDSANRIRAYRKDAKLSQEELAKSLGITASYLSSMERGTKNIPTDILKTLSAIFKVSTDDLLGNKFDVNA